MVAPSSATNVAYSNVLAYEFNVNGNPSNSTLDAANHHGPGSLKSTPDG